MRRSCYLSPLSPTVIRALPAMRWPTLIQMTLFVGLATTPGLSCVVLCEIVLELELVAWEHVDPLDPTAELEDLAPELLLEEWVYAEFMQSGETGSILLVLGDGEGRFDDNRPVDSRRGLLQ